ncbi:MAG: SDR family oxidoreductase [Sedimentisphaerales bacterium]|nr:SDR family oxidoreductase [Sedimentisphaerales bacterium]
MNLSGLTCLITGSTGSLGAAIALALAQAGCHCICHYHTNQDKAEALENQITALGQRAAVFQADLRDPDQIDSLFEHSHMFGGIRVLINSAAMFVRRPLSEITSESIREMLAVNLTAPLIACRNFATYLDLNQVDKLIQMPCAKIINLVDVGGIRPWADYAEYCSSKAALIAVTKSLAKELAPAVTVNAVAPGIILPDASVDAQADFGNMPDNQKRLAAIPIGRFGFAAEIVHAVLFLLSNDYITGQVLQVDGGRVI